MKPIAQRRMSPGRVLAALALIAAGLAACTGGVASPGGGAADPASAPSSASAGAVTTAQALADAHDQLRAALDQAGTCDSDAECRSIAVGGKACGGPTGYAAYSARLADPAQIEALARREHDLALQEARESHRVSNCLFLADPGARCEAHRCVTGGPHAGPNPQR